MWVRTHPSQLFRKTIFRPFAGRCWLKFVHALENDQGLLTHTQPETGVDLTIFNNEHSKIGLKFSVLAVITMGPWEVTSRNFSTWRAARHAWQCGYKFSSHFDREYLRNANRTSGAGRLHVGLCPIFLVLYILHFYNSTQHTKNSSNILPYALQFEACSLLFGTTFSVYGQMTTAMMRDRFSVPAAVTTCT